MSQNESTSHSSNPESTGTIKLALESGSVSLPISKREAYRLARSLPKSRGLTITFHDGLTDIPLSVTHWDQIEKDGSRESHSTQASQWSPLPRQSSGDAGQNAA